MDDEAPNLLDALLGADAESVKEAVNELSRRALVDPALFCITIDLNSKGRGRITFTPKGGGMSCSASSIRRLVAQLRQAAAVRRG